jgi:hypothetical protein
MNPFHGVFVRQAMKDHPEAGTQQCHIGFVTQAAYARAADTEAYAVGHHPLRYVIFQMFPSALIYNELVC